MHPRDLTGAREPVGRQSEQGRHTYPGEKDPTATAQNRKHRALGHEVAEDVVPAGPHSRSYRDLPLPGFRPHQYQVRDVGARDQQNEADRAQQDPKGLGEVADDGLFERVHQDTELPRSDEGEICVRALVAFHEAIDQGRQKGLGHVGGSPGSEPGNRIEAEASRVGVVGIHGKREPQSRLVQDIEFAGKHPDDFPGCSI